MTDFKEYQSPFSDRYASREMSYLFSPYFKFFTWRKLWIALAKSQKALGLPITEKQIEALQSCAEKIDLPTAEVYEKKFRHDVMAHIHAFGDLCPGARGIIHLGATSCFVTDNTDLIQMRQGFRILQSKILQVIRQLYSFAQQHAALSCLSYTHFQSAQPTTVGKRACIWLQDLLIDLEDVEKAIEQIRFLGVKGATGTQASFLSLFEGDHAKVKKLEDLVAKEMGFSRLFPISGQSYTRKQDIRILSVLTSFASSAHKFATDLRLLAHLKEIEEPFAEKQVGSSAMPYKRNPMRSERVCGLCRFLMSMHENPLYTEATQWFERTLDDSANRRLCLPQAFLTADAILNLLCNITAGLIVHPKIVEKHLQEELPFLATEQILMQATKKGKDRQIVHERLRVHALESSRRIKEEGLECDLIERISLDKEIGLTALEVQEQANAKHFIGRAMEQTHEFLDSEVAPLILKHKDIGNYFAEIKL
jgi:adenylosuccinate lyase